MHGDRDTIVSPIHLLESKEFLVRQNLKIRTKLFKNCEHKISVEGSSLGLEVFKKKSFITEAMLLQNYPLKYFLVSANLFT